MCVFPIPDVPVCVCVCYNIVRSVYCNVPDYTVIHILPFRQYCVSPPTEGVVWVKTDRWAEQDRGVAG